jgi:hypothetical protein
MVLKPSDVHLLIMLHPFMSSVDPSTQLRENIPLGKTVLEERKRQNDISQKVITRQSISITQRDGGMQEWIRPRRPRQAATVRRPRPLGGRDR